MMETDGTDSDYIVRKRRGEEALSIIDFVVVIVRRKWVIVGMTAVVAVLALAFLGSTALLPASSRWNLLPTKYKPTSKVLIQDGSSGSSISSLLSQSGAGSLAGLLGGAVPATSSSAQLALALLRSRTLEDEVVDKFGFVERYHFVKNPRTSARSKYEISLKTRFDEKSGVLEIGYEDIDKDLATSIVNEVTDRLLRQFADLTMGKVVDRRIYLERAVATQQRALDAAATGLGDFQNKYGVYDLPSQTKANISTLASLQGEIARKQMDLDLQSKYIPDTDIRIVLLKDQIGHLQQQMNQLKTVGSSTGSMPLSKMVDLSAEYAKLSTDVQVQQAVLLVLKQQLESTKIDEQDTTPTFQIIEKAEIPEVRSRPNRARLTLYVTILGFLVSIVVSFFLDYIERARRDPVESKKLTAIGRGLRLRKGSKSRPLPESGVAEDRLSP